VALHRPDYVRAPKIQKPSVARVIVRAIRNGDPPGRFLKKDEKTGKWIDIGDKRAAEKTSQALREKTIDEKDENTVKAPFTSPTLVLPTPGEEVKAEDTDGDLKEGNGEESKDAKKEENGDGKDDAKETEKGEKEGKSKDSKSKEKDDAMEVDESAKKTGNDKSATTEVETVEV
jgi:hypothetical protein